MVIGKRLDFLSNVISTATARRLIRKGCEAFWPLFLNLGRKILAFQEIPINFYFSKVFLKDLLSLPHEKENEFTIGVILSATPLSIELSLLTKEDSIYILLVKENKITWFSARVSSPLKASFLLILFFLIFCYTPSKTHHQSTMVISGQALSISH